jgi:hypothetical protein
MHAGREADNQQSRPRIAEGQYRTRMVARLAAAHLGEESRQTRAIGTG